MRKNALIVACTLLILSGCAGFRAEVWMPAELPLPSVTERLETPEFWIDRTDDPDMLLMSVSEIGAFNRRALDLGVYLNDVFSIPETKSAEEVRDMITPLCEWAENGGFIGHDNFPLTPDFFVDMKKTIALDELPEAVTVRWGMTVRETDVRVLPTKELAMEAADDYQFDYFQMSRLSWGTPVAVIRETVDESWSYIVSPYVSGWVESDNVGTARNREMVMEYLAADPFVMVTGPMVPVYGGGASHKNDAGVYLGGLRLGSRVPLVKGTDEAWRVTVPVRDEAGSLAFAAGFIEKDATVNVGYLPYTQRNVITTAFSMLDERYGWGGMWGYWDCSAFVRDVFGVFGFVLPRNSTSQAKVGTILGEFDADTPIAEKCAVLDTAPPGMSILRLPGHVMIYLGTYDGAYYVIHDIWAYRTRDALGRKYLVGIGRVAVSELTLGKGGARGSLIERITHVVLMTTPENGADDDSRRHPMNIFSQNIAWIPY